MARPKLLVTIPATLGGFLWSRGPHTVAGVRKVYPAAFPVQNITTAYLHSSGIEPGQSPVDVVQYAAV